MSRSSTIREQNGVGYAVDKDMGNVYFYVNRDEQYDRDAIRRHIVVETVPADAGHFPANIRKHFWVRGGKNDGDSWISCGQLTNDAYFFFTASCCFTGFDAVGSMRLWVSNSWKNIVEHAMNQEEYNLYMAQTAVPPIAGEDPWPVLTREEFFAQFTNGAIPCYECHEYDSTTNHPDIAGERVCSDCYTYLVEEQVEV
jgi:hypothetical protein